MHLRIWMAVLCLAPSACSAAPELSQREMEAEVAGAAANLAVPREYVDARSYFTSDDDLDAWYALTRELEAEFDDICGDTFCEGDYGNYRSLGLRCSVEKRTATIGTCVWTFAASQEEVAVTTGSVEVAANTWTCQLPVARGTRIAQFVRALSSSNEGPLRAGLPRHGASLYDGLVSCL